MFGGLAPISQKKAIAKSQTLRLQSCFVHIFLNIWTEVPFIQELSGVYNSLLLDTDELQMALWAQKVSRDIKKRAPDFSQIISLLTFPRPTKQVYLTIISWACIGYEMVNKQWGP